MDFHTQEGGLTRFFSYLNQKYSSPLHPPHLFTDDCHNFYTRNGCFVHLSCNNKLYILPAFVDYISFVKLTCTHLFLVYIHWMTTRENLTLISVYNIRLMYHWSLRKQLCFPEHSWEKHQDWGKAKLTSFPRDHTLLI